MGVSEKIKVGNKAVVVPALVSSGYEAEGPELSIPVSEASKGVLQHRAALPLISLLVVVC